MRLIAINSEHWFTNVPRGHATARTAEEAQVAVLQSPNHKPSARAVVTSGPVCVASPPRPSTASGAIAPPRAR